MPMMVRLAALALCCGSLLVPIQARAAERIAVLITPGSAADAELAENLTEIVIARIAERQKAELADKTEFSRRLGVETDKRAQDCLEDVTCLGRVGVVLGVSRVVNGTVKTTDKGHIISMVLTNIGTGTVENRFFQLVPGAVEQLIHAIRRGTDALFVPAATPGRVHVQTNPAGARVTIDERFSGTAPVLSQPLPPGAHQLRVEMDRRLPWEAVVQVEPGTDLQIKLESSEFKRQRVWPSRMAFGTLAGAALSLTTGIVFGVLSQQDPGGSTRMDVQNEVADRRQLATTANVLFAIATALSVGSATTFLLMGDEILD